MFRAGARIPLVCSSDVYEICATQIDETTVGQSTGFTCGNNPVFAGIGGRWDGPAPSTCLGIPGCYETLGGVDYVTLPLQFFKLPGRRRLCSRHRSLAARCPLMPTPARRRMTPL